MIPAICKTPSGGKAMHKRGKSGRKWIDYLLGLEKGEDLLFEGHLILNLVVEGH